MGFQDSGIIKAETKWEQELGIDLNNVWWETQYVRPHPVLYSASYKSRSCKWLICPNPDVEDDVITLPAIKVRVSLPFLSRNTNLLRFLKTVLSSQLQLCPLIAVTGTPNEMFALNQTKTNNCIHNSHSQMYRTLTCCWYSGLSVSQWIKDVMFFFKL